MTWFVAFISSLRPRAAKQIFAEAASCGICIAECPWTRPTVRPKLLATMAKRLAASQLSQQ